MRKLTTDTADLWVSNDFFDMDISKKMDKIAMEDGISLETTTLLGEAKEHLNRLLNLLDSKESEYMSLYGKSVKRPRIAVLCAHGIEDCEVGDWRYKDGQRSLSVQSWIEAQDGKYGTLVTACCNPTSFTPKARKSLLLVPDISYSLAEVGSGAANFGLVHPIEGELDHIIDYALKEIKKKLEAPNI